jgi:hypothetical protein
MLPEKGNHFTDSSKLIGDAKHGVHRLSCPAMSCELGKWHFHI